MVARWSAEVRAAAARYAAAGGSLVAGGLAYSALFAIVPAIVLTLGVLGFVMADPTARSNAAGIVGAALPPIRDLVKVVVDEAARSGLSLGLIAVVPLTWAASRFGVALEVAIGLAYGETVRRGPIRRNVAGLLAVLGLVAAVIMAVALPGVADLLGVIAAADGVMGWPVGTALLRIAPVVILFLALAAAYRIVPLAPVPWAAVRVPAAVVTLGLTVLAQAFVALAPMLVESAAVVGSLASVFIGLAWLGVSFQGLLFGAAWTSVRVEALGRTAGS